MRTQDVYIAAVASSLPGRLTTEEALADGRCDPRLAEQTGVVSVSVSLFRSPPELAATAAAVALERSGISAREIRMLLHADVYYQGHDLWAPGSYIQRVALGNRRPAIEIRQLSNGGMAALELAAHVLRCTDTAAAVLATTGDTFHAPGFDRWRSDPGTIYGDGGTAAVLSNRTGFAAIRSIATVSDPSLEGIHRGEDPFSTAPFSVRSPMDLEVLKRAHLKHAGLNSTVNKVVAGQQEALETALKDADVSLGDIDLFVLPHFGLRRLTTGYLKAWDIDAAATTWPWARTVGHLGAGDQFAGLEHLVRDGRLRPGQRCLLAGVGAGYTWSCAVIDVHAVPAWSDA